MAAAEARLNEFTRQAVSNLSGFVPD
jgi:hypothetical protein